MHFVHNHGLDGGQVLAQQLSRQHDLQRLGSRDEQIGRLEGLPSAVGLAGVAVANGYGYMQLLAPFMETAQHVPVQGAQWRDVNGLRALALSSEYFMKYGECGSFGLSGPGGRDEEHIFSGQDRRNGLLLRQRRLKDGLLGKHRLDLGMKLAKSIHWIVLPGRS